jgi:hypothetical protein
MTIRRSIRFVYDTQCFIEDSRREMSRSNEALLRVAAAGAPADPRTRTLGSFA